MIESLLQGSGGPEQTADTWLSNPTIADIINNEERLKAYRKHAEEQMNNEIIDFVMEVKEYRERHAAKVFWRRALNAVASHIFLTYIKTNSPYEINLSHGTRKTCEGLFDEKGRLKDERTGMEFNKALCEQGTLLLNQINTFNRLG